MAEPLSQEDAQKAVQNYQHKFQGQHKAPIFYPPYMSLFKSLFSFSQQEIDFSFQNAKPICSINGLKLLRCTLQMPQEALAYGKLLIITPRKAGKAHDRNNIRRQLKAIFYTNNLYKKPVRSIILVYKNAMQLTFEQLTTFLTENFKS